LKLIARRSPAVVCGEHELIWPKDSIRLAEFAYDSPVR
jgi:hypothetical protein